MKRSKYLRIFGIILLAIFVILAILLFINALEVSKNTKDAFTKFYAWGLFVFFLVTGPFIGILTMTVADNCDDISALQSEIAKLKKEAKKLDDTVQEIAPPKPTSQPRASEKRVAPINKKIEVGSEVELTKTHYFEKFNLRMYKDTKGTVVEIKNGNEFLVRFNNGYIEVQDWVGSDEIRAR